MSQQSLQLTRKLARRYIAEIRAKQSTRTPIRQPQDLPPLLEWIPQVSGNSTPPHEAPHHLADVTRAFEDIGEGNVVRVALSVPPRHWKTTTILHGIAYAIHRRPGLRVLYLTFSQYRAEQVSRDLKRIVKRSGMELGDRDTQGEWSTENDCVFRASGIKTGATGEGFDLIVVDDPYHGHEEAESHVQRAKIQEGFEADVLTRQGNEPTSFVVVHTRWHVDDVIGRITQPDFLGGNLPFRYINLPAIDEEGNPLLPAHWPVERLQPWMENEYVWASQFMGQPRPRGHELFQQPVTCSQSDIPRRGRFVIGVDLAYSAKTQSDYSVAVVLRQIPKLKEVYVQDVVRKQCRAPDFLDELNGLRKRYQNAPMYWYAAGSEKGAADFIKDSGARLRVENATTDKFVRAQPVSAAWNAGEITVPFDAPWSDAFIDELRAFTGTGDARDDQVDALAAAWDFMPSMDAKKPEHQSVQRRVTANWGAHF